MKTKLFFFAMFASVAASAQTLNIKITKIDYYTKIATCDLSWTGRNATHLSDVWIFVDYIEISGNAPAGSWKPTAVTGATVIQKTTGNAAASTVAGNTRGVWIKSVTSGADFTGQITLQLSGVPAKFNACAYASDYPPNAASYSGGSYTFKGTKPFIVNGTTINDDKYAVTTITSLTDATGCPGGVGRDEPHNNGECLPHLTVVGSYCRDLTDDNALSVCGLEFKKEKYKIIANYSSSNHECPSGWRPATYADVKCAYDNGEKAWVETGVVAADVLSAGLIHNVECCASCSARWHLINAGDMGCGDTCGRQRWPTIMVDPKCMYLVQSMIRGGCVR
jgi:hypothetical protein